MNGQQGRPCVQHAVDTHAREGFCRRARPGRLRAGQCRHRRFRRQGACQAQPQPSLCSEQGPQLLQRHVLLCRLANGGRAGRCTPVFESWKLPRRPWLLLRPGAEHQDVAQEAELRQQPRGRATHSPEQDARVPGQEPAEAALQGAAEHAVRGPAGLGVIRLRRALLARHRHAQRHRQGHAAKPLQHSLRADPGDVAGSLCLPDGPASYTIPGRPSLLRLPFGQGPPIEPLCGTAYKLLA
mmetsp:Transcript_51503/g.159459  ORF Transcript_51503/g.159459 Transcript_51503/m.159459 type:complete len:240 (+) Transcript_51503:532-1251(+)